MSHRPSAAEHIGNRLPATLEKAGFSFSTWLCSLWKTGWYRSVVPEENLQCSCVLATTSVRATHKAHDVESSALICSSPGWVCLNWSLSIREIGKGDDERKHHKFPSFMHNGNSFTSLFPIIYQTTCTLKKNFKQFQRILSKKIQRKLNPISLSWDH